MELYKLLRECSDGGEHTDTDQTKKDVFLSQIEKLIDKGVNVNYQSERNNNEGALHIASSSGLLSALEVLINHGAVIEIYNSLGQTPLMYASINGRLSIVEYLTQNKAMLDSQDKFGCTALVRATLRGHLGIVKHLTEMGANIHIKNYRFGASAFLEASYWGYKSIVDYLLQKGAEIEERDFDGRSALLRAASIGHRGIVELLVEKGADINAATEKKENETPLHRAAFHGHFHIIRYLVEHGANKDARTVHGLTPLDLVRSNGRLTTDVKEKLEEYFMKITENAVFKSLKTKIEEGSDSNICFDDDEFEQVVKRGFFRSYDYVFYLAGPCNVGKTTLASLLIGEDIPDKWESTNGLEMLIGRCCIHLQEKKLEPFKENKGNMVYEKLIRGRKQRDSALLEQMSESKTQIETDATKKETIYQRSFSKDLSIETLEQTENIKIVEQQDTAVSKPGVKRVLSVEIQQNFERILSGDFEMEIAPCDIVDFGGQLAFDMTHQLFIHHRGLILLMFNGRKDLHENLVEYGENVQAIGILQHWVDSILAFCPEEFTKKGLPQIHFVATHSDLIEAKRKEDRRQELIQQLDDVFKFHEKARHLFYENLFFINTTNSYDIEICRLKKALVDYATDNYVNLPMAWAPLLLQFDELREKGVVFLTIEEVKEINSSNDDLSLSPSQLRCFLRYEHSVSRIVFFDELRLDRFVVIQPMAMVDILKSFITDERFWPKQYQRIFDMLVDTGQIHRNDLLKLWSEGRLRNELKTKGCTDFMINLLCRLDILIRPYFDMADYFFVPSMIKNDIPGSCFENLVQNSCQNNNTCICLSFHLKVRLVPSALISRLIGSLMVIWNLKKTDQNKYLLYSKSAVFVIDEDNDVLVRSEGHRIVVYLLNKGPVISDVVLGIQETFTTSLKQVIYFYRSSARMEFGHQNYKDFFSIEIGVVCDRRPCLISADDAKYMTSWICLKDKKTEHETKFPLMWTHTIEEKCDHLCKDLDILDLERTPNDHELLQFVNFFPINHVNRFLDNLPLRDKTPFENTAFSYKRFDASTIMFMSLYELRGSLTFFHLERALWMTNLNQHHLCQAIRRRIDDAVYAYLRERLESSSAEIDEKTFCKIAKKINEPKVFRLGIELGLSVPVIESILISTIENDPTEWIFQVLLKWQRSTPNPTILQLIDVLQNVDFVAMKDIIKYVLEVEYDDISREILESHHANL